MRAFYLITAFVMATLSLSAQTSNEEIKLTDEEFETASTSKDIHQAMIEGNTFYYTIVESKPNLAVIVGKKRAYAKLKEVILPETFTSENGRTLTIVGIGEDAFKSCYSLKKIDLPKTVRIIGKGAFRTTHVDELDLKEGLLKIGEKAFIRNSLQDIYIPDGVLEIGEEAFFCDRITVFGRGSSGTLYLPKSVTIIGKHAFAMSRNGYGAWFNSKRKVLCLPDYVNLDNCKKMGISRDSVEEYLKGK